MLSSTESHLSGLVIKLDMIIKASAATTAASHRSPRGGRSRFAAASPLGSREREAADHCAPGADWTDVTTPLPS
ncbi:uncharacterized protein J3R85_011681 [Psidium guajava]|nr:uncharacterized protein J3R85_011681 [Psidium guajava]